MKVLKIVENSNTVKGRKLLVRCVCGNEYVIKYATLMERRRLKRKFCSKCKKKPKHNTGYEIFAEEAKRMEFVNAHWRVLMIELDKVKVGDAPIACYTAPSPVGVSRIDRATDFKGR